MSWLNNGNILKDRLSFGIWHEGALTVNFDYLFSCDPTDQTNEKQLALLRPLLPYTGEKKMNLACPIIGSFGFGFPDKEKFPEPMSNRLLFLNTSEIILHQAIPSYVPVHMKIPVPLDWEK